MDCSFCMFNRTSHKHYKPCRETARQSVNLSSRPLLKSILGDMGGLLSHLDGVRLVKWNGVPQTTQYGINLSRAETDI